MLTAPALQSAVPEVRWISANRLGVAWLLMFLSGAASLAWQVIWTTQLGAGLGHEIVAVLAVLAAFFGGLALGALGLARLLAHSRWAGRWYAGLEAVLALWGLVLAWATPGLMRWSSGLIGPEPSAWWHWCVAFGLPMLLLLPATAAMGATLPAIERQMQGQRSALGGLYAVNTLGAVVGLLGGVFWALPQWGLLHTSWLCAAANTLCALLAAWAWWRAPTALAPVAAPMAAGGVTLPLMLLATGLLGIGHEVLAVRVLSQVTENTVYSYALLLAVYLLGTAVGAAAYQRRTATAPAGPRTTSALLWALAGAVALSAVSLWWADVLCAWPARVWGHTAMTALAGETLAAAAAMLLPTLLMGALFTHLCLAAQAQAWPLGRALACNTAGAALAPAVVGVGLLPWAGPGATAALLVLGYLGLVRLQRRQAPARAATPLWWLGMASALAWIGGGMPLRLVDVPEGGRILSYRDGVMAAVSVVADDEGVARLRINNRAQEGSSASGDLELRLAQLPLVLHPAPVQTLLLGLGTGFTAAAAAQDTAVRVKAVELLPEVIEAAALFSRYPHAPQPAHPVHVVAADARRHVQSDTARYDVVVADLFHPARSGAGSLYTVEQFQAVRLRLAPGGLYCQWLAVHQMDLQTLRSIVAAFVQVYPGAYAVLASNSLDSPVLGLVARPDVARVDLAQVRERLQRFTDAPHRTSAHLEDEWAALGSIVAGPAALARFAAQAEANTDDRPLVAHGAPWGTYAPQTTPRARLLALLQELQPNARELLAAPSDADARRLAAYWQARRRYIEFGATVQPHTDPVEMLNRVQPALLDVLRESPDFRPARAPLLALAQAVSATQPERAHGLMTTLQTLQPAAYTTNPALSTRRP